MLLSVIRMILLLIGLTASFIAWTKNINIYLKFDHTPVSDAIQQFNHYLQKKGVIAKYKLDPFFPSRPVHITLYLANFPEKNLKQLLKEVGDIALHWPIISLKATHFFVTESNYVMLDVPLNSQDSDNLLQELSDDFVFHLHDLRDVHSPIPIWAKSMPEKQKAFQRYGSPNVYFEYSPHFTLMVKQFKTQQEAIKFQLDMKNLIQEYQNSQEHSVIAQASFIGVGYTDEWGQITHEIAQFKLSSESNKLK